MDTRKSGSEDLVVSHALSLSLAGVFRDAEAAQEVEGGKKESAGKGETVEISSDNTGSLGPAGENIDPEGLDEEEDEDVGDGNKKMKKMKHHRHTAQQIREMEVLFKESPHPDEKQRLKLSRQLDLSPRQVKFWFQNRRTQIKAMQERHENNLLKSEMEKLLEENRCMREVMNKARCPSCGIGTASKDAAMTTAEHQLRIENARLKAELTPMTQILYINLTYTFKVSLQIEKLRGKPDNLPKGTASPSSSWSASTDKNSRTTMDSYRHAGCFRFEKSKIMQTVNRALDELTTMATSHEPLWVRSLETGHEILNYDEYRKAFAPGTMSSSGQAKLSVEASREIGMVFSGMSRLVKTFMDVKQWKEMFPCMISRASIIDVICEGGSEARSGLVQLMFSELHMLTPVVPPREFYHVRHFKHLSPDRWAIVDVSIDHIELKTDSTHVKFKKRPSGCIIEDKGNGHCKVIWVEHMECQRNVIPTIYRSIVINGLAFGAQRWIAKLQQQCERMMFFMATNVPTKDSIASQNRTWTKVPSRLGDDIRFTSRKNVSDPGEPIGLIICAVCSTWLPIPPMVLFDFLRDETRRTEWDIMLSGVPVKNIVNLVKGKDHGNTITVHVTNSAEGNDTWVLQDSCTNAYQSMIVYAHVDADGLQSVLTGCDSTYMAILPSGFIILPDGIQSRPNVITSRPEEKSAEGGSILTVAFQVLVNASPTAKLTMEAVENVNALVACTVQNIRRSLQCEDV